MEYTPTELAVADKLGIEPALVKQVIDTFEIEFDRIAQEQYDYWVEHEKIKNPNGLLFTDMIYTGVMFDD